MKKYKCRVPLISPQKITMLVVFFVIITIVLYDIENDLFFICCGFTMALFAIFIFNSLAVCKKYAYCQDCVKFFYLSVPYKKIYYDNYCSIIISNASYNNGYAYGPNGNILMQHKVKNGKSIEKDRGRFCVLTKNKLL